MTAIEPKWATACLPVAPGSVPVASGALGSWEFALRRRTRAASDLAIIYDGASENWARMSRRFQLEAAYRDPLASSGVANALSAPDAQVLDCGIGSGSLSLALARFAEPAPDYHGIDTSGAMLAAADAELRRAGIVARLRKADVRAIPYSDRSFDVVMAAHVLEHLPKPAVALREMIRVLKPGGVLLVCMMRRSAFGAIVQLRWRTWIVSERQGAAWLQDAGLTGIGVRPIGLGFGAGQASTAFWARKPLEAVVSSRNEGLMPRGGTVR